MQGLHLYSGSEAAGAVALKFWRVEGLRGRDCRILLEPIAPSGRIHNVSVLIEKSIRRFFVVGMLLLWIATAFGHEGQVRFGEAPVPGAAVQATRGAVTQRAVTDTEGHYSLPGVTDGAWTIRVSAPGFETMEREVTPGSSDAAAALQWDLKMLPIEGLQRTTPSAGFAKPVADPATLGRLRRGCGPSPY